MKRILLLLVLILTISLSVYARGFNLSTGIGYTYKSFTLEENNRKINIGFNAFQAQIGVDYILENNMFFYGDFSMAFPSKIFVKSDGEKQTLSKNQISALLVSTLQSEYGYNCSIDKVSLLGYGFSIGCGYCFKPVWNMSIKLGGGFRYDAGVIKLKDIAVQTTANNISEDDRITLSTIGLNVHLEADYLFSDHVGIMLSLKPNIGFHTFLKSKAKGNSGTMNINITQNKDYSKCSFTFNATAGMIFAF